MDEDLCSVSTVKQFFASGMHMDAIRDEPSTTLLVHRCLQGEMEAWSLLVERYARLVRSVPVRYGLTADEVDDVAQEVFLALAQSLHEIEDPERLSGWLATTTRRFTWRALQRQRREQLVAPPNDADPPTSPALPSVSNFTLDDLLNGWFRQEALEQALRQLSTRCQELLHLLFLDEQQPDYDEISRRLNIPKGSIGPTRNRCLQRLRSLLEEVGITRPF
ncbi:MULTISPECIES: RNA polymerase sigma factor [Caldilinea]|jgi:RNA polymerase sigma factor (sigma-70 family)|nr:MULTISPECIES: sigma-70 family RNA polymerase sigma factor [Caldilinea]MBO9391567.1 sigma-70 family RNA polymerase sigma factor [Caldilinea sp.]GIV75431.1 MAG: RNA polymerase sigma factor [Caldilinea sp.]